MYISQEDYSILYDKIVHVFDQKVKHYMVLNIYYMVLNIYVIATTN